MPRCYLLAVSDGSALDRDRNTFSLFNLVEELKMGPPPEIEGIGQLSLPFEVHAYWELDENELGVPFHFRLIHVLPDGEQASEKEFDLVSDRPRQRVRIQGLPLPAFGAGHIQVEWREVGQDGWTREKASWPLNVVVVEAPDGPGTGAA